jgi:hypothetical protein
MKKKFTNEQRFAIWSVYGKKCFHCEEPLALKEVNIDHLIPERLLDDPEKLQAIKIEYGLSPDFSINDYCNWVPAHPHCNRSKGTTVYPASPALIMHLGRVRRKGEQARRVEGRLLRNRKSDEALGELGIVVNRGIVSKDEVVDYLRGLPLEHEPDEPIVITFSLNTDEVLRNGLPSTALPTDYPSLCDWLEKDFIKLLSSLLTCSFFYPEASERTGETLSVRLAFLQLNLNELDKFTSPWWEISEIQYYSEVYGSSEWALLKYKNKLQNTPVIDDSAFIELLHLGGMLISFTRVTKTDYRAVAFSQDYMLYQTDSYYDLNTWREILELANIEDWEIEQALAKVDQAPME